MPAERAQRAKPLKLQRLLARTLPQVTEHLAAALSGAARAEPSWSDCEWRIARAVAVMHGVSPLLSKHLAWTGPPGWRDFLASQRAHTAARFRRMAALLELIDGAARTAGIAFIALKGAALHALDIYVAGERPMADIDLLVRPQDLGAMNCLLVGLGYRTVSATDSECVLVPVDKTSANSPAEHADNAITIEVHAAIRWRMPVPPVDITAELWPTTPHAGRNGYRSAGALMAHLLMHAAVNMQVRSARMVQLHDMALLAPRLSATDWSALLAPAHAPPPWWALPPLQLLRRYYPAAVPPSALAAISSACPALLKLAAPHFRLSAVSVSNARRPLFPALLWARSVPEACSSLGGRLRAALEGIGDNPTSHKASELQPWIESSSRRRVLDVLFGRPRPETVLALAAALQGDAAFGSGYEQPRAA